MKYFKCGNCQKQYQIDETKIDRCVVIVQCVSCQSKNAIRLGPTLVLQSNSNLKQFSLKMGENVIGRATDSSQADILISDEYISRNHLSVFIEEKEGKIFAFVQDNKSLNGTFNHKKTRLKPGLKYPFTTKDYYIAGLTKIVLKFN